MWSNGKQNILLTASYNSLAGLSSVCSDQYNSFRAAAKPWVHHSSSKVGNDCFLPSVKLKYLKKCAHAVTEMEAKSVLARMCPHGHSIRLTPRDVLQLRVPLQKAVCGCPAELPAPGPPAPSSCCPLAAPSRHSRAKPLRKDPAPTMLQWECTKPEFNFLGQPG